MKIRTILLAALTVAAVNTYADITVGVGQSGDPWLGFMNWTDTRTSDWNGASGWGPADLTATFDDGANTLTLGPNTIGDPADYWYIGGGGPGAQGAKIMEANLYIENDALNIAGSTLTFAGNVLSDTFTSAHASYVFIKDFASDYGSVVETKVPVTAGAFSINYTTSGDAGRHIQYGFQTVGENVWVTDVGPFGSVVVETIPEPTSIALLAVAAGGIWGIRRFRG